MFYRKSAAVYKTKNSAKVTGVKLIKISLSLKIDSVTEIGKSAFQECEQLAAVTLPSGLTVISDHLFRKCQNLKSVTIPDGVTVIGNRAFRDCISLSNVSIPDSVTKLVQQHFISVKV